MDSAVHYSAALAALSSALVLYAVFQRESPIQHVVGPPSSSWIFGETHILHYGRRVHDSPGHMRELVLSSRYGDYEFAWQRLYGSVYRLKGCFGVSVVERILTSCSNFAHFHSKIG